MGFLWTIIIGFVVGLIARMIKPGKDAAGFIVTTLLGVAGALLGALLGRVVGLYSPDEPAGFIMSVLGAMIILWAVSRFSRVESES